MHRSTSSPQPGYLYYFALAFSPNHPSSSYRFYSLATCFSIVKMDLFGYLQMEWGLAPRSQPYTLSLVQERTRVPIVFLEPGLVRRRLAFASPPVLLLAPSSAPPLTSAPPKSSDPPRIVFGGPPHSCQLTSSTSCSRQLPSSDRNRHGWRQARSGVLMACDPNST
ncbi:hypothetical protein SORBI_3001G002650 [Sorghum bicolor]|uniref:Uncharacterized protein n=1 Tax=Sorghum bicolor TaxID=4558 RepID=A0A1Z5S4B5_SORBI|nr:hypothetical protein SORBI_3001G002650 [Sorghum bicolor]